MLYKRKRLRFHVRRMSTASQQADQTRKQQIVDLRSNLGKKVRVVSETIFGHKSYFFDFTATLEDDPDSAAGYILRLKPDDMDGSHSMGFSLGQVEEVEWLSGPRSEMIRIVLK